MKLPDAKRPTLRWALKVLRLWEEAGRPTLVGNDAEKVKLAREMLETTR